MMNYTACTRSSAARNWLRNTEINTHQLRIGFWICISTSFSWVFLVLLNSQMIAESYRVLVFFPVYFSYFSFTSGGLLLISEVMHHHLLHHFIFKYLLGHDFQFLLLPFNLLQWRTDCPWTICLREVRIYLAIFSYSPGFNCPTLCWWRLKGDQR